MSSSSTWPVRRTESYGGVVVRDSEKGPEVVLIQVRNLSGELIWALPKGMADPDESPEQTALREVREETGLTAEILRELPDITYWFSRPTEQFRYRKTVRLFLMHCVGGNLDDHDCEVEQACFVLLNEAIRRVKYPTEKTALRNAKAIID